ncbi:hypothetical protein O9992_08085 [Vibrio lentus]|nr:hypothetical protein [Vibrio lentus]
MAKQAAWLSKKFLEGEKQASSLWLTVPSVLPMATSRNHKRVGDKDWP